MNQLIRLPLLAAATLSLLFPRETLAEAVPIGKLSGTIFLSRSGKGIAAARLEIGRGGPGVFAGIDGAFSFRSLSPKVHRLSISAEGVKSNQELRVPVEAGRETYMKIAVQPDGSVVTEQSFSDLPAGRISGRILSSEFGETIAGASVRLIGTDAVLLSDSGGRYAFDNIGAGSYTISVEAQGCPVAAIKNVVVMPGDTSTLDIVPGLTSQESDTSVGFEGTIAGMAISSETGDPVAAVQVTVENESFSATTDSRGFFRIADVPSGCYYLNITSGTCRPGRIGALAVLPRQITRLSIQLSTTALPAFSADIVAWGPGMIGGAVVDAWEGTPLVHAAVVLDEVYDTLRTDTSGAYLIPDLMPGTYTARASVPGYVERTVPRVSVFENQTTILPISLERIPEKSATPAEDTVTAGSAMVAGAQGGGSAADTGKVSDLGRVAVVASVVKSSDAGMLRERQMSFNVSDAVSAEQISRTGAGNAADAMKRVTGATVMEGKYVYVRGLGDRYVIVLLNGAELPTTDPDKRIVPLDIFPSVLIENINTIKTFTPDMPGNFAAGCIDIQTKAFPEKLTFSVSGSGGGNTQTTFRNGFLTYQGGRHDWLGFDDGTRAIPERIRDTSVHVPDYELDVRGDRTGEQARLLDTMTNLFTPDMAPETTTALPNGSFSVSLGNTFRPWGAKLGTNASLSYSSKRVSYANSLRNKWMPVGNYDSTDTMGFIDSRLKNKSADEYLWGALFTSALEPIPQQRIACNIMYTRSADDEVTWRWGEFNPGTAPGYFVGSSIQFKQRGLLSLEFRGTHQDPLPLGIGIDWRYARVVSTQDEPDTRFFQRSYDIVPDANGIDSSIQWEVNKAAYTEPMRVYRNLKEGNRNGQLSAQIPVPVAWTDTANVNLGGSILRKERTNAERRFGYANTGSLIMGEDPAFFTMRPENLGLLDTAYYSILKSPDNRWYRNFGAYVYDNSILQNNYTGTQEINACFLMTDIVLPAGFRATAGVRYESANTTVASADTTIRDENGKNISRARLTANDWLPAALFSLRFADNFVARAGYSRTLLRPSFRELAPYSSENFETGKSFFGNPYVRQTVCHNADARLEWYPVAGDLVSVGGYYKYFIDPIEIVGSIEKSDLEMPVNSPSARAAGLEFESRIGLGRFTPSLEPFSVTLNAALMYAKTRMSEQERDAYDQADIPRERDYQGAAPYVVNALLTYDHDRFGLGSTVFYNVLGPRLLEIWMGQVPEVYEEPLHDLGMSVSKKLGSRLSAKLVVQNILNPMIKKTQTYHTTEYLTQKERKGISLSLSATCTLK